MFKVTEVFNNIEGYEFKNLISEYILGNIEFL